MRGPHGGAINARYAVVVEYDPEPRGAAMAHRLLALLGHGLSGRVGTAYGPADMDPSRSYHGNAGVMQRFAGSRATTPLPSSALAPRQELGDTVSGELGAYQATLAARRTRTQRTRGR
jgi:hypothetical protein